MNYTQLGLAKKHSIANLLCLVSWGLYNTEPTTFPKWEEKKSRFTPSFLLCVFLLEGLCEASGFVSAAINWEAESCQVKHQRQSSARSNQIIISLKAVGFSQK